MICVQFMHYKENSVDDSRNFIYVAKKILWLIYTLYIAKKILWIIYTTLSRIAKKILWMITHNFIMYCKENSVVDLHNFMFCKEIMWMIYIQLYVLQR